MWRLVQDSWDTIAAIGKRLGWGWGKVYRLRTPKGSRERDTGLAARRRGPVCKKVGTSCWRSRHSRHGIGRVYAQQIRLNQPSARFGIGRGGPRAVSLAMACYTWCSSWGSVRRRLGDACEDSSSFPKSSRGFILLMELKRKARTQSPRK